MYFVGNEYAYNDINYSVFVGDDDVDIRPHSLAIHSYKVCKKT